MDEILKILFTGNNLASKIDVIKRVKEKYPNQFLVVLESKNMPNNIIYEEYWQNFDAVFFFDNNHLDNENVLKWLGHNHFRFFNTSLLDDELYGAVVAELECLVNNIELERKLLIKLPNIELLLSKYPVYKTHIEQTYLNCPKGTHRIRKRLSNDIVSYFETIKIRLTNSKCVESENIIDSDMYNLLMKEKDETKDTIIKDRYYILYEGNRFELDIYEFWNDQATVELEIPNENYIFNLPPEFELIKDVSDDYMYKNKYLAGLSYENSETNLL